jgi:hypothetical protein
MWNCGLQLASEALDVYPVSSGIWLRTAFLSATAATSDPFGSLAGRAARIARNNDVSHVNIERESLQLLPLTFVFAFSAGNVSVECGRDALCLFFFLDSS